MSKLLVGAISSIVVKLASFLFGKLLDIIDIKWKEKKIEDAIESGNTTDIDKHIM